MIRFIVVLLVQLGVVSVVQAQAPVTASVPAPLSASVDPRLFVAADQSSGEPRAGAIELRPNRPRSALRGAGIGGLITGTAAVVGVLIASGGKCDENLCYLAYPLLFTYAAVPGAVLGGLVGWNIEDDEKPAGPAPQPSR